jgi:hypothetical protein
MVFIDGLNPARNVGCGLFIRYACVRVRQLPTRESDQHRESPLRAFQGLRISIWKTSIESPVMRYGISINCFSNRDSSASRGLGGWVLCLLLGLLVIGPGCSTPQNRPATMALEPGGYEACFDAVILVARESGMPAILRDRAGGVVETAPRLSGSFFEPWRLDNASFSETIENTVSFQRRRARFEFVPADFVAPSAGDPNNLEGPPLPGSTGDDLLDVRTYPGPLEVRVWVYVERAFTPGARLGTWTRSQATFSRDTLAPVRDDGDKTVVDFSKWTPVRRDPAYEQRLLEALSKRMAAYTPDRT